MVGRAGNVNASVPSMVKGASWFCESGRPLAEPLRGPQDSTFRVNWYRPRPTRVTRPERTIRLSTRPA